MSYPLAHTRTTIGLAALRHRFRRCDQARLQEVLDVLGRASRSEYWWFALYLTIVYLVLGTATAVAGIATSPDGGDTPGALAALPGIPMILLLLASIVPGIAVSIRRLHDAGYSGWLYLINLVPYLGGLVLIIFLAMPTSPAAAKYGPPAPSRLSAESLLPAGLGLSVPAGLPTAAAISTAAGLPAPAAPAVLSG